MQVPESLGDQLAACRCPILPVKTMGAATSLELSVRSLGDVCVGSRPDNCVLLGGSRQEAVWVLNLIGETRCMV
jgi:hypothetical protein